MNNEPLSINAEDLKNAKDNLDIMLVSVMDRMLYDGFDEGTVTLKINIALQNKIVTKNGRKENMKVPFFENRVSGGIKRTFKFDGVEGGKSVLDTDAGDIRLVRIDDGQMSMFEED